MKTVPQMTFASAWGALVVAWAAAVAEEIPAPPTVPPTPTAAVEAPAVSNAPALRDPFWPVGYTPRPKGSPEASRPMSPRAALRPPVPDWPALKVKGYLIGPRGPMAILDGIGPVEAGNIVRQRVGGYVFRWRIDRIQDQKLTYTELDVRPADEL